MGILKFLKGRAQIGLMLKRWLLILQKVIETAEKKEISNNCSTGIYYFKTVKSFLNAYNDDDKKK